MSNIYNAVHQFQRLGMRLEWSAGWPPTLHTKAKKCKSVVCVRSCMVNVRIQGLEAQGLHHLPLLLSPRRVLYCENRVCLSQDPSEQAEQCCCQQHPMKISSPRHFLQSHLKLKVGVSFRHLSIIIYIN